MGQMGDRAVKIVWPVRHGRPPVVKAGQQMGPLDLIDEESGLCVMRTERRHGHDLAGGALGAHDA